MNGSIEETAQLVGDIIRQCLREGMAVAVDGLGTFRLDGRKLSFEPASRPRVFLAYVDEDYSRVRPLYDRLEEAGFEPWLDKRKLLAGQDWPRCIERAISVADIFVPCYSRRARSKRGQFQKEVRQALECAARMPIDDCFVMPVRLEECTLPRRLRNEIQYVDLFPDWKSGADKLVQAIEAELRARANRT
jgi:hypothetical protein